MHTMLPADSETIEVLEGVYLTQLAAGEHTSIQHFHIESGARVPAHSHDQEQAGYVTQGTFTFVAGGEEEVISPGESYVIPSGEEHAAENRADVPVDGIDVFSPPRTDPAWVE